MNTYILYSDESGDFCSKNERQLPWLVGGIWADKHDYSPSRLKKLVENLRFQFPFLKQVTHFADWNKKSGVVEAVLEQFLHWSYNRNIRFVSMIWKEDRYRGEKNNPVMRHRNMVLELCANLAGRNPEIDYADKIVLHPAQRSDRDFNPTFEKNIFKAMWHTYQNHGLILSHAGEIETKTSSANIGFDTDLFFFSDFLLGVYRMLLKNPELWNAPLGQLFSQIPYWDFCYETQIQDVFEKMASAFVRQSWGEFLDHACLFKSRLSEASDTGIKITYQNFYEKHLEKAQLKWQTRPEQARRALEWAGSILARKEQQKYDLALQVLQAAEHHPELIQTELYALCKMDLDNHSGITKIQDQSHLIRNVDMYLSAHNAQAQALTHQFAFADALAEIEQYCEIRHKYIRSVMGSSPCEDRLLGTLYSNRGHQRGFLQDFTGAWADFDLALGYFNPANRQDFSQTSSYALLAACDAQNQDKITYYRDKYLQVAGVKIGELKKLLESPSKIDNDRAYVLKVVLRSLKLVSTDAVQGIIDVDPKKYLRWFHKNTWHPNESVLIHWARLVAPEHPDKARDMFWAVTQVRNQYQSGGKFQHIFYLIGILAAMYGGLELNDAKLLELGQSRLRDAHDELEKSCSGWFSKLNLDAEPRELAQAFIDLMRMNFN